MPLSKQFREAATGALLECYPIWNGLPLEDFRRVLRPSGLNTHSISVEPYRGSSTWITFIKSIQKLDSIRSLEHAIANFQPEFSRYLALPGRSFRLGDCVSLISAWCHLVETHTRNTEDLSRIIAGVLNEVEATLESRRLTERATVYISGLKLPISDMKIQLEEGVVLRSLSEQELMELGAQDITYGHQGHDVIGHSVTCCLELAGEFVFSLEEVAPQSLVLSAVTQRVNLHAVNFLRACHILKPGRAGIFLTKADMLPKVFPNMDGGSSWPLQRSIFSSLDVLDGEVEALLQFEAGLRDADREELRIAADRLVDAENRLSPVDSLLDAVIGLEVLLNPMDASELAFRVALNYAFLSSAVDRRERYDRVRLVQKTRNRVVHGGLNLQSQEAQVIHEHASLAKACLRDALAIFLTHPDLKGNQKLDADFWLERVLPSPVIAAHAVVLSQGAK